MNKEKDKIVEEKEYKKSKDRPDNTKTTNPYTNNYTQKREKVKKVKKFNKIKPSNKNQIERDDSQKEISIQIKIQQINDNIIPKNDNNNNNEDKLNDIGVDNINTVKINENNTINSKKEELRGTLGKNPNYIHNGYYDLMLKRVILFVKFFFGFFNPRCERYGLDKLIQINVEKAYGLGYKRHKRFLKRRMQIVFGYRNKHNKEVIKKMMDKDKIFALFMEMKVKEAFIYYEANYPFLHLENSRRFLSHFTTLANALNKKEKYCSRKEFEKIKKSDFEKTIDEERNKEGNEEELQKRIKKKIYCIRY